MRHLPRALAVSLFGAVLIAPMAAHADLITDGGFEMTQLPAVWASFKDVNGTLNGWLYSAPVNNSGALLINSASTAWLYLNQIGYGGNQFAGIQATGAISQSFSAPSSGTFSVSWLDAGRSPAWGSDDGAQTYIASLFDNTTSLLIASTTLSTT